MTERLAVISLATTPKLNQVCTELQQKKSLQQDRKHDTNINIKSLPPFENSNAGYFSSKRYRV